MKNLSPLRINIFWAFLGQGIYLGCQWLLLVIFARHGGAEAAGLYALGLAASAPIIIFANLHLRELQANDTQQDFRFQERLAVRLGSLGCILLAILVSAWWIPWQRLEAWAVIAVAIAKAIESVAELGYGAMQAKERFRDIAQAQAFRGVVGLLIATVTYLVTSEVALAVTALAAAWLTTILLVDVPRLIRQLMPERITPRISPARLAGLLKQALPLGMVSGIGTFTLMLPSYAIRHHLGTSALGSYSAMLHLLMIGTVASIAMGQAASPRLARNFANGDRPAFFSVICRLCGGAMILGIGAIAVVWSCGEYLLLLAYGEAWRELAPLFLWMACAATSLWLTAVIGYASTASRRFISQVPIAIAACVLSAFTSWWLVPAYGLVGAAWSTMSTCGFLFVSHLLLVVMAWHGRQRTNP